MLIQTAFNFSSVVQCLACRFSGLRLNFLHQFHFLSAAPPRWRSAFSQFAPVAKFVLALAHGRAYSTRVKNQVFVCASVSKVGFAFGFALGTFGFVLALVQAHFSGYAAGFGWLLCGLGF